MRISPRKPRGARSGPILGAAVLTALLVLSAAGPTARAQVMSHDGRLSYGGLGGYTAAPGVPGFYGNGLGYTGRGLYNGLRYGTYGYYNNAPGPLGLGFTNARGYGGFGLYNGLGYGAFSPYYGQGYGGYGYGTGLNINLGVAGGRNLLHIGRGVNPLWRGGELGFGRGYYSRNWYARDFDDWYDGS